MSAPASRRWLFGPTPDLLFGCGLVYAAVFVALSVAGDAFRSVFPFALAIIPINLISSAHYGATALRAYERADDRRKYATFTVWTTLLLGVAFVTGLRWEIAGSWFITTYLTWSPWHYAGQNFGIAMTFLRRRGVNVTPRARSLLHLSFVTSFVLALLALHGQEPTALYAPNQLHGGVYSFVALGPLFGVPVALSNVLFLSVGVVYLGATGGAVACLLGGGRLRDLAPTLVLIFTQALWFSVPALSRHFGVLDGLEPLGIAQAYYAFLWIGAGHALQYVWITAYFAKAQGRSRNHGVFVVRALLAGTALWGVPALLFAPGLLGRIPYDEGLATMVAALVNLHHFVLDGVIWKLRDGRVARFLLGARGAAGEAPPARPFPVSLRAGLWIGGVALFVLSVGSFVVPEFAFRKPLDRGDLATAEQADAWLEAVGQSSADRRLQLGQHALTIGDLERAERHLRRSLDLRPKAWAWVGLGDVLARREQWVRADEAYRAALQIEPHHAVATFHAGVTQLRMGRVDDARATLTAAWQLAAPDHDVPPGLRAAVESVLSELPPAPAPR